MNGSRGRQGRCAKVVNETRGVKNNKTALTAFYSDPIDRGRLNFLRRFQLSNRLSLSLSSVKSVSSLIQGSAESENYREGHLVADLGWVDNMLDCFTTLPGCHANTARFSSATVESG